MPSVSVIVPVYNAEPWLDECVRSVIDQTEADWELILVDDGATDRSPQMCDDYAAKDARIRTVHKANGGLSDARNAGIDTATGDFILFLDADDRLHHEAVKMLLTMQRQTGAEICIGDAIYTAYYEFKPLDINSFETYDSLTITENTLYQVDNLINSACGKLYRRELFDDTRFTVGTWYEDLDFFYRIFMKATKIARTRQCLYHYRANPASFINNWSAGRTDALRVTDRLVEYMKEHGTESLQRAASDRRFSAYFNIFVLATKVGETEIADKCWQVIRELRISELFNTKIRIRNRIGAIISLFGRNIVIGLIKCGAK
jgi:glycosyltransferase involved in cell wall biosynthesis